MLKPPTAQRVRHLIVILKKVHEAIGFQSKRRRAAPFLLPFIPLTLVKVAPLHCRNEFLRRSFISTVVGFAASRRRNFRAMMKIIIPERIQAVTVLLERPDESGLLHFVFGNN